MAEYKLTLAAKADYENIGRYTQRRWGARQRRIYLADLVAAFKRIADNIHLGIGRDDVRQGKDTVEIIRILHGRASVEKAFFDK